MEAATCQGFQECDSIIPTSLPLEPLPTDNIAIAIYKQATCSEYKKGWKKGGRGGSWRLVIHSAKTAEVLMVCMRRQNDAVRSGKVFAEAVTATARSVAKNLLKVGKKQESQSAPTQHLRPAKPFNTPLSPSFGYTSTLPLVHIRFPYGIKTHA